MFAQLVRALPKMKGCAEKLPAFVFAVARHVRSRGWRRRRAPHSPLQAAEQVHNGLASPYAHAASREQLQTVLNVISEMDADMRVVFLLRFVEGFSINDVADALSLPVGTVKSHIHRGRAQLRAVLIDTEC